MSRLDFYYLVTKPNNTLFSKKISLKNRKEEKKNHTKQGLSKVAYWCHITCNTFLFYGFSFFILYETACTGIRLLRTNLILSICMYQPAWTISCYNTLKCKIYRLMCKIYRLTFKFYKLKSKIYALNCNINEKKNKKVSDIATCV